jgi:actin-like ATPase involved in cell morphogenesis
MKACGIDLGTTNSCVHVVSTDGPKLILDAQGNKTVPSVVYQSRDGKQIVGFAARNRMGELHGPIATIKRKMGSNETVVLGGEQKSPVEISAMILRYLKELAEAAEGEEVDRAVVTVPAYFAHIQRQHTDDAARAAGFKEVTTLLEPVAAALAYSLESEREQMRVFVYDLGGGTFDATVLEKDRDGGLSVLSFGGDPYLGGDNFDARIVKLLLEKLTAKNYLLDLNLENPEDFSRYQRLKFFAENAKIGLTGAGSVNLVHQGLFSDQAGELIDLDLTVTREELEACTSDLVERSIEESINTLKKKQIDLASIDEIIMVGGMSRMPLVRRRLAEAFGREPKLVDPDLIVSRGAAIKAAHLYPDRLRGVGGLTVDLRYDRRTDKRRVRVAGVLNKALEQGTAYLLGTREERSADVAGKDRFAFEGVVLEPARENAFTVSIEDAEGASLFGEEIKIVQDDGAAAMLVSPGSVVTKAIAVRGADGIEVLFPENTMLPHFASLDRATGDQSGKISLPLLEGDHEIQVLTISDIPEDLPVGTPVRIEVSIQADYQIQAKAGVPSIQREVGLNFRIEPLDTKDLTTGYIQGRLDKLRKDAEKGARECTRASEVAIFRVRFNALCEEIDVELGEPEPNRLKIREKMVVMEALIRDISQQDVEIQMPGMTHEEFSKKLTEIETEAIKNNHPRLSEVRPQIERVRAEAKAAWGARDRVAWLRATSQIDSIESALQPEKDPREMVEGMTGYVVYGCMPEVEAAGARSSEVAEIKQEAMNILLNMKMGNIQPDDAVGRLRSLYRARIVPLRKRFHLETEEMDEGLIVSGGGSGLTRKA